MNTPIHDRTLISNWLKDNAHKVFASLYQSLDDEIFKLQVDINNWISGRLNQIDLQFSNEGLRKSHQMPDINNYLGHINLSNYGQQPQSNGILEGFLAGIGKIIEGIIIVVENIFTSDIKVRRKEINDILNGSRNSYKNTANYFSVNLKVYLEEVCRHIEEKSVDRAKVYLGTLSSQLSRLEDGISQQEAANYRDFLSSLVTTEECIVRNYLHLEEYTNGIGILTNG